MRCRSGTILLAIAAALAACGSDDGPSPAPPPEGPTTFTVMTQNLYLGADLDLLTAPGAPLSETVERIWAGVQATDFDARVKLVADGIQAADADVVGLQEATLWRTQAPGDHLLVPNATAVAHDFLDALARELVGRGLLYGVVNTIVNGDAELGGASGTDYRLTDRDAILAKASLPITSTSSGTFPHLGTLELPPLSDLAPRIQAAVPRGWVTIEFSSGGRTVRLVNAHLEAFSAEVASQQALDLVEVARPAEQPTIVLGDMNLPPGSEGYGRFVAPETGLADAWTVLPGSDSGLTCCWSPDLRGGAYDKRIDLVFTTDDVRPTRAAVVNRDERTAGGLAPSDHAGVVVVLTTK
jgi:endonuclease/exonuclease/phosphatase family metal-dependent hydrolase